MDARARKAAKVAYQQANRAAAWDALGLDRAQLASLRAHLEERGVDDCRDEFHHTRTWATASGLEWSDVQRGLRSQYAFCDCQALVVDPDSTF